MFPDLESGPARCGRNLIPRMESLEGRRLMSASLPTFVQTNLASDGSVPAAHTDPYLINAWGIVQSLDGTLWVADNGTGLSSVYNPDGSLSPSAAAPLIVRIPPPAQGSGSAPTGILLNTSSDFVISENGKSAPGSYFFSTEDGTISAWSPTVDLTNAVLLADRSASGAVYKGIAASGHGKTARLYAANFNAGTIDVFDGSFKLLSTPKAFVDSKLPAGFAPFNVANIGNKIYVSYAKQNDAKHDDVNGAGNGFVDVYNTAGKLVRRLASGGTLNSPWAMLKAPSGFGKFSNDIIVGNFGDGAINVFSNGGKLIGQFDAPSGQTLRIDGLWGITPGTGANAKTLFFAAGPSEETHGLFGSLAIQGVTKAGGGGGSLY